MPSSLTCESYGLIGMDGYWKRVKEMKLLHPCGLWLWKGDSLQVLRPPCLEWEYHLDGLMIDVSLSRCLTWACLERRQAPCSNLKESPADLRLGEITSSLLRDPSVSENPL